MAAAVGTFVHVQMAGRAGGGFWILDFGFWILGCSASRVWASANAELESAEARQWTAFKTRPRGSTSSLRFKPLEAGESRSRDYRVLFKYPLVVWFRVVEGMSEVQVLHVRSAER